LILATSSELEAKLPTSISSAATGRPLSAACGLSAASRSHRQPRQLDGFVAAQGGGGCQQHNHGQFGYRAHFPYLRVQQV